MADETTSDKARSWLAFSITVTSILGVIVLAAVIVFKQASMATQVLATVLPVIGTWVGTILAFYFGKENFETAAKSVGDLAKQLSPSDRLRGIPVKTKMIPLDKIFYKTDPIDGLKIIDVINELKSKGVGDRLPVLTDKLVAKYMIHRSEIDKYLAGKAMDPASAGTVAGLTFANLFADNPDMQKMFATSFAFVNQNATLADAKAAMEQTKNCEDVFITAGGTPSEPVMGWVTDNIIQTNLQA